MQGKIACGLFCVYNTPQTMQQALLIDTHQPFKPSQKLQVLASEFAEDLRPEHMAEAEQQGRVWVPHFSAQVSCGLFGISDDYIEKYQSLDSRLIKNKASTFFFSAASNSMEPLIMEGDILVVDRSVEVISGRVAVVCLGGEMLCKRIIKKAGQVTLRSDNPAYKDIKVTEEMDLVVFGVVISVARELI